MDAKSLSQDAPSLIATRLQQPQNAPATTGQEIIPALTGLRAVAALAILCTHVAFSTGFGYNTWWEGAAARLDMAVAVFFMLSGFMLWRRYAIPTFADTTPNPVPFAYRRYLLSRIARILPAYWLVVLSVLVLLPPAFHAPPTAVLSLLTLTQNFTGFVLWPGLTHLWSLSVEVGFYLLLPVFVWVAIRLRLRRGGRILGVSVLSVAGLLLDWLPIPEQWIEGSALLWNPQVLLPPHLCCFAFGMIAAELTVAHPQWRCTRQQRSILHAAALVLWCWSAISVPVGLVHPSPAAFTLKVLLAAACGAAIVLPYCFGGEQVHAPWLCSPLLQRLGRWSYGIFLWHVPVLLVLPAIMNVPLFHGYTMLMLGGCLLITVALSRTTFMLVEQPCLALTKRMRQPHRLRTSPSVGSTPSPRIPTNPREHRPTTTR